MTRWQVFCARVVAQSVVTIDDATPNPTGHTVVVQGAHPSVVEAALALYQRAHLVDVSKEVS